MTQVRIFNFLRTTSPDNFSMHVGAHSRESIPRISRENSVESKKGLEPPALTQVLQQEFDSSIPETMGSVSRPDGIVRA